MQSRKNQKHVPLGEFEALVLMAILRLADEAYGVNLHREIEERTGRRCSFGALYTTLDRMEDKGYVSSSVGESSPERGGRAKKYFKLQGRGSVALKQSVEATMRMAEGIPLLEGAR